MYASSSKVNSPTAPAVARKRRPWLPQDLCNNATVYARDAYEFQGPGVTNPRLLRDFNEVHHRIYAQLTGLLMDGKDVFPPDILAVWLCGEGRDDAFRVVSLEVFERCLKNFNAS
jgi:hypothetical protein